MEYTKLGDAGVIISVVGFGGWAIGGHGYGAVEDPQSIAAIRRALDSGITLFDTADVYGFGHSEEILARALEGRIKDVIVATKFGVRWDESGRTIKDCSIGYIRKALEGSLRRLRTDCIPLYQLHWHDGVTPLPAVFETLLRLQEEGKIRYIGCSNLPISDFRRIPGSGKMDSAQLPFSLVFRQTTRDLADYQGQQGIATLVYGVLARGLLSGKYGQASRFGERDTRETDPEFRKNLVRYAGIVENVIKMATKYRRTPSQVAIRWVLEQPSVSCALVGVKTEEQVSENAGAVGWRLEKEDREYLDFLGRANEAGQ
ncbi:MAG: general stress protein [Deltaproteobacteria bacterium]|nr:MAG: general stress protein [Deltaproteobacteria bacterium]